MEAAVGASIDSALNLYSGIPASGVVEFFDADEWPGAKYSIKIIPALNDNFTYLIISESEATAIAIDPLIPLSVLKVCRTMGVTLSAVFTTHYDYSGGNAMLAEVLPELEIMAGERDADRTPAVTRSLADGEIIDFAGLPLRCIATPCHTRGHVSLYIDAADGQPPALFTGGTLFIGGVGRFFEGDAEQMLKSLAAITALPQSTRIFCGHEYTVPNLEFAASLEPANAIISLHLSAARARVAQNLPTVPSTIAEEMLHNPFLRLSEPELLSAIGCSSSDGRAKVLALLRSKKDNFGVPARIATFAFGFHNAFQGAVSCFGSRSDRPG